MSERNINKQPEALPYLFLTEMWERFGFYVINSLLVLFLTLQLHFDDSHAYSVLGAFTAFVFLTPVLGGYVADRYLGFVFSISLGAVFLGAGYFLLAIPWAPGMYYGLALAVVGCGLLKPNVSSLLGGQYQAKDIRRDAGFTLFYIGINMGSLTAGITAGLLQRYVGWYASFAVAGCGLVIAYCVFQSAVLRHKVVLRDMEKQVPFRSKLIGVLVSLGFVYVMRFLLVDSVIANWVLNVFVVLLAVYLLFISCQQRRINKHKMLALLVLILVSIVFWALYLQMFFSLTLFIQRNVNRFITLPVLGGWEIPTSFFVSLEAVIIVVLGGFFAQLWKWLQHHGRDLSLAMKFFLSTFIAACAFILLGLSANHATHGLVSVVWVFVAYLLISIAELLISPIGLSAVTRLSPKKHVGMMMGVWFMATAVAGHLAGLLAMLSSVRTTSVTASLHDYQHAFYIYGFVSLGFALFVGCFVPTITRFVRSRG